MNNSTPAHRSERYQHTEKLNLFKSKIEAVVQCHLLGTEKDEKDFLKKS